MAFLNMVMFGCCFSHIVSGIWRFARNDLLSPQSIVRKNKEGYFIAEDESITLTLINESNPYWSITPTNSCKITTVDTADVLTCSKIGKYNLELKKRNCSNCNISEDQAMVRINENLICYHWNITTFSTQTLSSNGNVTIQVSIGMMKNFLNFGGTNILPILNNIFYFRGEKLIVKDFLGRNVISAQMTYNSLSNTWILVMPNHQSLFGSFVAFHGKRNIPVFGCGITSTILFLNQLTYNQSVQQGFRLERLIPSNNIIGQVKHQVCASARGVLPTANGIFYTTDDFVTTVVLHISTEVSDVNGVQVTQIEISRYFLLIILNGELFAARLDDEQLRFKKVTVEDNPNDSLIGITLFPMCLVNPQATDPFTWESGYVLVWSSRNMFVHHNLDGDVFKTQTWKRLQMSEEYLGIIILETRLENIPDHIWILALQNSIEILECSFENTLFLSCSDLTALITFPKVLYKWEFLNSAHSSAILWTDSSVIYTYDDGEQNGPFLEVTSVKTVAFSSGHSKYLILTKDNLLFFGSGKATKLTRLRGVDEPNQPNVTYTFRYVNDDVMRISWNNGTLKREVYPLYHELYSALQDSRIGREFCDYAYIISNLYESGGNVVDLEAVDQELNVNFSFVYPASMDVRIKTSSSFQDRLRMTNATTSLFTRIVPGRPLMRVKTFRATIRGTCTKGGSDCNTGVGIFEISVSTDAAISTCLLPLSQVLFINITCPDGLNIRIREGFSETPLRCDVPIAGGKVSNVGDGFMCSYTLQYPYEFYPLVEVYSYDRLLSTVHDDVELKEIYNRTGFEILRRNFMLRDCSLCEEFHNLTPSAIILQTAGRACPCKLDTYEPNQWTGNLSFLYVERNSSQNELSDNFLDSLTFDVKVLGNSHCDLSRRLRLTLRAKPFVSSEEWELLGVISFVSITILLLCLSYWKYNSKDHNDKKLLKGVNVHKKFSQFDLTNLGGSS